LPFATRVNRGKMSLYEVAEKAAETGAEKVLMVDRLKGGFARIRFLKVHEGVTQVPPSIHLRGARFRREFKARRKDSRVLFIECDSKRNPKTDRLIQNLSDFLELPVIDAGKAVYKRGTVMRVSEDPLKRLQISFYFMPKNIEVGPRILVSRVVWEI